MIMQIFAVYDTASGSFARPMFVASRGVALRVFSDEVNRKADDNMLFNHPEDFQLFPSHDHPAKNTPESSNEYIRTAYQTFTSLAVAARSAFSNGLILPS